MALPRPLASTAMLLLLAVCTLPAAHAIPSAVESGGAGGEKVSTDSPQAAPSNTSPDARSSGPRPSLVIPDLDDENNVYFEPGTSAINDRGRKAISAYARKLKSDPQLRVVLRGFSDPLGSRAYNLARSQDRVDAVERALENLGVPIYQIRKQAYEVPDADPAECSPPDCHQDRKRGRVDLVLSR